MSKYLKKPTSPFLAQVPNSSPANLSVEERHRQLLALLEEGKSPGEIAAIIGYSPRWVRELVRRYRTQGGSVLSDHRRQNRGASTLLSKAEQAELRLALQHPPAGGGKWNGPKVADWIAAKKGRKIARQRGYDYLRRLKS